MQQGPFFTSYEKGVPTSTLDSDRVATDDNAIITQTGTRITGYTQHGIDRAIGDGDKRAGVKPQAIIDAVKHPNTTAQGFDSRGCPFEVYRGEEARVVINPETGQIVSVNPLSGQGVR